MVIFVACNPSIHQTRWSMSSRDVHAIIRIKTQAGRHAHASNAQTPIRIHLLGGHRFPPPTPRELRARAGDRPVSPGPNLSFLRLYSEGRQPIHLVKALEKTNGL